MRRVTLVVEVAENKNAKAVIDHLVKEANDPNICGLADFCNRKGIVIRAAGYYPDENLPMDKDSP
jgi:hypothetical protein